MAPDSLLPAGARECPSAAVPDATVEIVIPVRNEERGLGPSVRRLHAYLRGQFPFASRSAEIAVLVIANVLATIVRFGLYRGWVFRYRLGSPRRSSQ
jgi:hypothetical protein